MGRLAKKYWRRWLFVLLWLLILGTAVIGAVFFFGTEYILRRKLNLQ